MVARMYLEMVLSGTTKHACHWYVSILQTGCIWFGLMRLDKHAEGSLTTELILTQPVAFTTVLIKNEIDG